MPNTNLTTWFSEDDIDDSEVTGAYGDVFGKSIEKFKDASSVSCLHATVLNAGWETVVDSSLMDGKF